MGTQESESDSSHTPWFTRSAESGHRLLEFLEVWAVVVMVAFLWAIGIGTAIWVIPQPAIRLPQVLDTVSRNWKACLFLIVPIFYKTILSVLARIKKFPFGMESQEPEQEEKKPTTQKPPRTNLAAEEDV